MAQQNQKDHGKKIGCTIFGGVIVIIIIWIWCWWWWCPFCPDEPCDECEPSMVVEDIHGATWMVLDNGWIHDLGDAGHDVCEASDDPDDYLGACTAYEPDDFRHGVLVQLGEIVHDGTADVLFSQVVLTIQGVPDPVNLGGGLPGNDPFDWLDINPDGRSCSIDAFHAYSLYQNDIVDLECDDAVLSPTTLPETCLRNRALHASFEPTIGIITYWSGENHYEVRSHDDELGTGHVGYTFCFGDPVTVDRWNEGCFEERYSNVTEIRIDLVDPDSHHSIFHDDPMDGGVISKP